LKENDNDRVPAYTENAGLLEENSNRTVAYRINSRCDVAQLLQDNAPMIKLLLASTSIYN